MGSRIAHLEGPSEDIWSKAPLNKGKTYTPARISMILVVTVKIVMPAKLTLCHLNGYICNRSINVMSCNSFR